MSRSPAGEQRCADAAPHRPSPAGWCRPPGYCLRECGAPAGTAAPAVPGSVAESFSVSGPVGVVAAARRVWTVSAGGGTVIAREDPSGAPPLRPTRVGQTPLRATYDGRLLWVSVFGAERVAALDPKTGIVVRSITRVDPRNGGVRTSRQLCTGPQGLAVTPRAVWLACTQDDAVVTVSWTRWPRRGGPRARGGRRRGRRTRSGGTHTPLPARARRATASPHR